MDLIVSIESLQGGRHVSLIQSRMGRRQIVSYHASAEALAANCDGADGIVIPFAQHGSDYDPAFLLEHIRLSVSPTLRKLPVRVYCADAGQRERAALMHGLVEGGASLVGPGKLPAAGIRTAPDRAALDGYVDSIANRPRFDSGRHDCANAWGAYSIVRASSVLAEKNEEALRELEAGLVEDTYYKKKIRLLEREPADEESISEVKQQLARFQHASSSLEQLNVLIAEDQWADGWGAAYMSVLSSARPPLEIVHGASIQEALAKFCPNSHHLVVLDMRLPDESTVAGQHGDNAQLPGVRLAMELREEEDRLGIGRTVPILAATASNKASTLDALLRCGINGYWVKQSPDDCKDMSDCLANLGDLYRSLADILSWSTLTRPWIQKTYGFAEAARGLGTVEETVEQIKAKALSINTLLFQAFNPFSDKMDDGLQFNICYLIIYSLLIELRSTLLVERKSDGVSVWEFPTEKGSEAIVHWDVRKNSWVLSNHIVIALKFGTAESRDFPESKVFQYLANRYGGIGANRASRLVNLRNVLMHGNTKEIQSGRREAPRKASRGDIETLLGAFSSLMACRTRFAN